MGISIEEYIKQAEKNKQKNKRTKILDEGGVYDEDGKLFNNQKELDTSLYQRSLKELFKKTEDQTATSLDSTTAQNAGRIAGKNVSFLDRPDLVKAYKERKENEALKSINNIKAGTGTTSDSTNVYNSSFPKNLTDQYEPNESKKSKREETEKLETKKKKVAKNKKYKEWSEGIIKTVRKEPTGGSDKDTYYLYDVDGKKNIINKATYMKIKGENASKTDKTVKKMGKKMDVFQ